ncbi:maleylpyruvate isomerase family mycothiol-dependent enzyme [Streptomyces sp. NPDC001796]|uniref:maleylpyruvate isomerase family mycothiol-dependent enzyme n=1 Tax=Streptomyces sp. NPDC001796 TaxID=3364609 RepID=UPI003696E0A7
MGKKACDSRTESRRGSRPTRLPPRSHSLFRRAPTRTRGLRLIGDTQYGTAGEPGEAVLPLHLAYCHTRASLTRLLTSRPDAAVLPVPACPGWTVYDTVAHLVANCRLAEHNLVGRPKKAAGDTLPELLVEWNRSGERVELGLRGSSSDTAGSVLVMDAYTHEFDIRHALASELPKSHPAARAAFDLAINGFRASVVQLRRPALRLQTMEAQWDVGDGEPTAVVSGTAHDLYRSLVGRRTVRQISELSWSDDPATWIPAFSWGPFRPPQGPVE